jgi:hypothetical protein
LSPFSRYENDGRKNFTGRTISTTADGASSVFAADLDGDGDTDLFSASNNDDVIACYENVGNEDFSHQTIATGADLAESVFFQIGAISAAVVDRLLEADELLSRRLGL